MKHFNPIRFSIFAISLFSVINSNSLKAQVQTPRYITIPDANSNGYYEYLPVGYNPLGTKTYPLLVFLHGAGEVGNGSPTSLGLVLRHGPPNMINWNTLVPGTFPDSFYVNGVWHKFIVISPQFLSSQGEVNVNAVLDYCISHYKVNVNKIYLTGLSMGGAATWNYASYAPFANKVAAIAPMATSSPPDSLRARVIGNNNTAVWAFHNDSDFVATSVWTIKWVNWVNVAPAPVPPAKKTIFRRTDHDCWSLPYNPSWTETYNGLSLYQWLLQFTRQNSGVILPVTLTEFKALLTGTSQITISWTTNQEVNNDHFTLERSADGVTFTSLAVIPGTNSSSSHNYTYTDNSPIAGNNFYRLSQTDVDGKIKYFDTIKVSVVSKKQQTFVVNPNPVKDKLTLELFHEEKGFVNVLLQDINGKTLQSWKFEKSADQWRQSLNIPEISRGMYIVTVFGNSFRISQKLIKE